MTAHAVHRTSDVEEATRTLLAYCRANDWAGYDPYDALNSPLLASVPLLNSKFPRLAITQALKRSPFNIRCLALIPKTQNPKAMGLFLSALLNLSRIGVTNQEDCDVMIEQLIALRSKRIPYWCWGYSFPWQMRTKIVPAGAPNLVCTSFVADALLNVYEQRQDARCLSMATSAAEYILNELYWTEGSTCGFSYPLPLLRGSVHNANFLAGALLCRIYHHTGEQKFLGPAINAVRYSASKQHSDGSWYYGEAKTQRWIDNFHTGYNLCALLSVGRYAGTAEFESKMKQGFDFYRAHFFGNDGAAKYFHNRTYPIDIHSVAQSIITLLTLRRLDPGNLPLARSVFQWALDHMWDHEGFFYYRRLRFCTIRTSYMRWSQAWMLLAMSLLVGESHLPAEEPLNESSRVLA